MRKQGVNNFLMRSFFISLFIICCYQRVASQSRLQQSINSNWEFHHGDITGFPDKRPSGTSWQSISLPHTWNSQDVNDDIPGYYRGICWYKRRLFLPKNSSEQINYLFFEGVNQIAEVYINGHFVGKHIGGYTAFRMLIQPFLNSSADSLTQNELLVKVDNSNNEDIPPLTADFTFYGGIYRDVYLVSANKIHFDLDDHGSNGIKLVTPVVNSDAATVVVSGRVTNQTSAAKTLLIISDFTDASGKQLSQLQTTVVAKPGTNTTFEQELHTNWKRRWSPDDPYLYRVNTRIVDKRTGLVEDELANPLALRWFRFDADKGFFLNGNAIKLIGASRHQDHKDLGNALPNALHVNDVELLKAMGGNFMRIAHYPQDPALLEACDRLGILVSVEIPIVNAITVSPEFYSNCKNMQVEMIRQNFNHPSVIIWGYMNEVMLRPKYQKNSDEQNRYFAHIVDLAKQLDSLTRKEDNERYTMIACHGDFDLYHRTGLTAIPQIVGWNLYQGWYSAGLDGFDKFLDRHHQTLPQTPMIVTEYGADGDSRIHSTNPERFDKSIEYQVQYHQHYLKAINERPFVSGAAIWNLADFNSETRAEATPHINTKGITNEDREPKDAYYFYQANLLRKPFLKIGAEGWRLRSGIANTVNSSLQQVEVFSNSDRVGLWLNGEKIDEIIPSGGVAVFNVPFRDGNNVLKASTTVNGTHLEDLVNIRFKMISGQLSTASLTFTDLNISVGDRRYFVDKELQEVWLPEQPYLEGSWGYVGGKVFMMPNARQGFGSDKNIYGTSLDAIYETQRIGIEAFKFDVADGIYDLTLGFAELESKSTEPALIYNLSTTSTSTDTKQREFDVLVNGRQIIRSLGTANYLQPQREYTSTVRVFVKDKKGLTVDFKAIKGETILNTIQLKKIF